MKKIYYQLSSVCQQKTPLNKGRYVFSWGGGRAREFWYFFQKKVLALPHVLIKKLLTPPLLGD